MLAVKRLSLAEFTSRVVPFLLEREIENNLLIGIALHHADHPVPATDAVWLAVEEDGAVVAAAVRTPPHYVAVSQLPPGAARAIADCFVALGAVPDGASGPDSHGSDVLVALRQQLGGDVALHSAETIYALSSVTDVPVPPGVARAATPSDLGLLKAYFEAFVRELALPPAMDLSAMVQGHVESGTALLWEDGGPRSLACRARKTATGSAIAPVYTPPESRRRGYGGAVTAELARRLLAAGDRFVCLFADQKNPTANHVYQSMGFRKVGDFNLWRLR
jgi:predicted GNAT family acetyltransferase